LRIVNVSKGTTLAEEGHLATSFSDRLKGLIGRKDLPRGAGFVIQPCSSIHTFFMSFAIDVLFVNSQGIVEKISEGLQPFRMAACFLRSRAVIELPEGIVRSARTTVGDTIQFQP
jgi:uncharacterized membrane protein (UPF0127 family)